MGSDLQWLHEDQIHRAPFPIRKLIVFPARGRLPFNRSTPGVSRPEVDISADSVFRSRMELDLIRSRACTGSCVRALGIVEEPSWKSSDEGQRGVRYGPNDGMDGESKEAQKNRYVTKRDRSRDDIVDANADSIMAVEVRLEMREMLRTDSIRACHCAVDDERDETTHTSRRPGNCPASGKAFHGWQRTATGVPGPALPPYRPLLKGPLKRCRPSSAR